MRPAQNVAGLEACVLELGGLSFATSMPEDGGALQSVGTAEAATVSLGVTREQARRLVSQVGKVGRLSDSRGKRLGHYRIQTVDTELGVLVALWMS